MNMKRRAYDPASSPALRCGYGPSLAARLRLAVLAALALPVAAHADPSPRTIIEIGSPDFRPYPMAIPDARDMGGKDPSDPIKQITEALRYDFDLAARFKVVDPKSYLADPSKEGLAAASIKFSDWVNVGAEGLIKCGATVSGNTMKADFRFFDVASGRQLVQKSFSGTIDEARRFAHAFADAVVEHLTGEKGIFQTRIAVVRKTKKGRELYVLDIDGKRLSAATNNGSINLLPSWSRDGRSLLFTSYIRHNPNLYSTPVGGGPPTLVSGERGLNTGGQMSPDGKRVALTLSKDGNSEIYVMNAGGSNLVRLTNEWAIDSSPSWSPDGGQIAFVSSRWGDPHIFVMNADGGNVRRVTDRGTYNQTPDWSPRGDLIAFTARDERNVFDIFTVNPTSKEIKRLTQDQGNNEEPSFSPDGNHIVFTSTREGRSQIWIMSVDGSKQVRVSKRGGFSTPAWSPSLSR
jgi:TolB protein